MPADINRAFKIRGRYVLFLARQIFITGVQARLGGSIIAVEPLEGAAAVLMHQGIGLDAFNGMPPQRAMHALYECCNSVVLAHDIARGRPYPDHEALFRRADASLFALSEKLIDHLLQAYPNIGRRPGSEKSRFEQSSVWDQRSDMMAELNAAAQHYADTFGFQFVMFVDGLDAAGVLEAIYSRLHHDPEAERKAVRNELARINRTRLERMLGPEGGYHNW
jgi:2-oxo-4-hydroxy-4-carboxy-5-ureidoimidazoline decarboxylase